MRYDQKFQFTRATEGLHYCDLILTAQEAEDLRALVQELQRAEKYPELSGVFRTILEETWRPECSEILLSCISLPFLNSGADPIRVARKQVGVSSTARP
jgi:hypothetical protein